MLNKGFDRDRDAIKTIVGNLAHLTNIPISVANSSQAIGTYYYEISHLNNNNLNTDGIITVSDATGFTVTVLKTAYKDTATGSDEWVDVTEEVFPDVTTSWTGTAAARKLFELKGKFRWAIKIVNQATTNTMTYEGQQYP